MRRFVPAVGAAALATALVAGCTNNGSSSAGGGGVGKITTVTPAAKGTVARATWNLPAGEPASLDYSKTWDTASGNTVLTNLCDNLMRQKPGGGYEPGLATAVQRPNPTTYVYRIRQGVTFTNGQPMTAQDVAYSLNRQLDPKTASYWALWFENVKSVAATSSSEVTVRLTKPDTVFNEMMSTPAGAVVSEAYVKKAGTKYGSPTGGVMCTGPFSLSSWTPGENIVLKANPDYWDTTLKPKVGTLTFSFLRDATAITNGLTSGSIDGTWQAPLAGFTRLRSSTSGTLYANPSTRSLYLAMASFSGALKDQRIRNALQKSIDYAGIVRGLLNGAASPATSVAPPASWGYAKDVFAQANSKLPAAKQDTAGAKKLIAAAGVPSRPIVLGYDTADPVASGIVASVQDSAQQVGLKVELRGLPTSQYTSLFFDPKARAGLDAFFVTSTLDVPDPNELYLQLTSNTPYNYTGVKDATFDSSIFAARSASDPTQRAQLIAKGQAAVMDTVQIMLPVASLNELLYLNKRLTGPPVSTLSSLYYPWAATLGAPR